MTTSPTDGPLIEQLRTALKEPVFNVELSTNLFGGQPLIHLTKPGATPRSKPVKILSHVIVGDKVDQPHSALLRIIADMLEEDGR